MNTDQVCARHFATGNPIQLQWEEGRIVDCVSVADPRPESANRWLAPALIDLQVNGYAGIDFQRDDLAQDDLLAAARGLARDGCARWLLTLITEDWERLLKRVSYLRILRDSSEILRHSIAGWHIEGPFLSAEPGFRGAHDGALMMDPTVEHIRELRQATGNDPVLLTIAPERAGVCEAIRAAVDLGFVVSLGHTDASFNQIADAVRAGARAFTHLGNACPRALDRHDNIVWRVLESKGLAISLIPDAIHVSAPLFRLIHRVVDPAQLFYVTDAMSAAGAPPGRYPLGKWQLEVGLDQVVRLPGQPQFAGSALRPIDGVRRAAQMLNGRWEEAWVKGSVTPARLMSFPVDFKPGAPADICLLEVSQVGELQLRQTWVRGLSQ